MEAHTRTAAARKAASAARRHTARRFAQRKRTRVARGGRIEMNQGTAAKRARKSEQSLLSGHFLYTHRRASEARLPLIVKKREKESADKPGSVEDNHSSAIRVAAYLQRPTREPVWATRAAPSEDGTACSPIWSCSRRGLPCHRVLPPARCALTAPFHPYRPLCRGVGGLLSVALSVGSRPPGVTWRLALGARTFLHACAQRLPGRLRPRWWWVPGEKTRGNSAQHRPLAALLSFTAFSLPAPRTARCACGR